MEDQSPLDRVRKLLETNALPQTTEVAFSCSSGGRGLHVEAWDVRNGAVRKTYKSDCDGEGSHLCMAGADYLLCALKSKPFILVWRLDKESLHLKVSCSGLVTAMTCHPEGAYCVAALGEKINIWQVSTGHLLAQISHHYQPVTVIQFTIDGAFFLSGGKDCLVISWNLGSVLSDARLTHCKQQPFAPPLLQWREDGQRGSGASLTRHVWSDHSLAVTGIHYNGRGGVNGRVATCSLDHTCKLYDFASGSLLCTFLFDSPLTVVKLDSIMDVLAVGSKTGSISLLPLYFIAQKQLNQVSCLESCGQKELFTTMQEHKKPVTALMVSSITSVLVSASEDSTCRVWDLNSKQTLHTVSHRGSVTSLLLRPDIWGLNSGKVVVKKEEQRLPLSAFRKQLLYTSVGGKEKEGEFGNLVTVLPKDGVNPLQVTVMEDLDRLCGDEILRKCSLIPPRRRGYQYMEMDDDDPKDGEVTRLKQEMKELKDVHRKLFTFTANSLLNQ